MAGQRPGNGHLRQRAEAPVVARRQYPLPLALGILAHFNDAQTVGRLLLAHLFQWAPAFLQTHAVGVQRRVDVLVIDHQQAAAVRRVGEREEMHAVVVVAGLLELRLPVIAGIGLPLRRIGQHRIAPGEEHPRAVPRRHLDPVELRVELRRNALETDQSRGSDSSPGTGQTAAEKGDAGQAQAALEQAAAALVDDILQRRVAAGVDRLVVMGGDAGVKIAEILLHRNES